MYTFGTHPEDILTCSLIQVRNLLHSVTLSLLKRYMHIHLGCAFSKLFQMNNSLCNKNICQYRNDYDFSMTTDIFNLFHFLYYMAVGTT